MSIQFEAVVNYVSSFALTPFRWSQQISGIAFEGSLITGQMSVVMEYRMKLKKSLGSQRGIGVKVHGRSIVQFLFYTFLLHTS